MSELAKLKHQRAQVKGQVTRILTHLESQPQITAAEADVRLKKLEQIWTQFEEIQTKIEDKVPDDAQQVAAYEAECEGERTIFEDRYFTAAAKAQSVIDMKKEEDQQRFQNAQNQHDNRRPQAVGVVQENHNRPRLPEIKLVEFGGEYTKWLFFRNSFETTVHNNRDLTPMQKHQYLIGTLQGEARKVIEGFTINNDSYENAWSLLKETYDNEMMIIETHVEELFNFPVITKEDKAESLRKFVWHIQTHVSSLRALSQPVETWDTVILHLAKKKLDFIDQRDWQIHVKGCTPQNMPTLKEFIKFLTDKCHTLRMINQNKPNLRSSQKDKKGEKKVSLATTSGKCQVCGNEHAIFKCEEFLKLSTGERRNKAKEKKLCMNCLGSGHFSKDCKASSCRKCNGRHNTLLHHAAEKKVDQSQEQVPAVVDNTTETQASLYCAPSSKSCVLLSTAQVYVYDIYGNKHIRRALLDPGSQTNLITGGLARELKIPYEDRTSVISGISQSRTDARRSMRIKINSLHTNFGAEIDCIVLPSITERLPQKRIDTSRIIIPKESPLADPKYSEPGDIDLLIGAGLYWKLIVGTPRNKIDGQPAIQKTQLGWIVGGEIREQEPHTSTCLNVTNVDLQNQLERFWRQETIVEARHYSKEDKMCEAYFVETTTRDNDGRFVVRLPMRPDVTLGESKGKALSRLESLERRFRREPHLKEAYKEFINDYIQRQHMSLVKRPENLNPETTYFIPHQAVIRPESKSTKLRVVFDASSRTSSGASLNDKLMTGPNLTRDLFKIVIRFRMHEYVLSTDMEKMFRQVLIAEADRGYQLILWRENPEDDPGIFMLNTVTYGEACAPFLAMRCLIELANLYRSELPLAAQAIDDDCYMDDVITGARTLNEIIELQQQLMKLLMLGQFPPRKWRSNDPQALQHLIIQDNTENLLVIDKGGPLKTLGLLWNSAQDLLLYQVDLVKDIPATKRNILSKISQVFDPLGLAAPVLVNGKLIMQQLWSEEIDWDSSLSGDLLTAWETYYRTLPMLNELQIPRNVNSDNITREFDLVGFGDASQRAFGACLYIMSIDSTGQMNSNLLCSKSRVAPLKTLTLPRLELEAALLLSQLYHSVKGVCPEKIRSVKLWSDSTIVLGWIKMEPSALKTFVANRVAKIQELTEDAVWNHVPSEENPADLLSRGIPASNLKGNSLWWHGPSWLRKASQHPENMQDPETELPELKSRPVTLLSTANEQILHKYSSFSKMCRIIAYCVRFLHNRASNKKTGPIEPKEIIKAEKIIIRWLQNETFADELRCLQTNSELLRKSSLMSLKPFVDPEGLIRVGGRLLHADIPEIEKHQLVLPPKHHITHIIMKEEHERLKHCPPEQLLHAIRARFWPISGRREAQKVTRKCLKCFRLRPSVMDVQMGDLPESRVKGFVRPFATAGVDYAGPLQIRESRRPGRIHISKAYVAVFTCFSTKAIHLELVTDLTSEAFLASLSRFTARRGICSQLHSDNGTNFIGAARELREIYEFLEKNEAEIAAGLSKQRITWTFIPPRAPHFGGLWEAAVKAMKKHLYSITMGKALTFEEYHTLLTEIEAILNSRPLTPLTNDPSDLSVLTPAHFLIGDSLIQPAQHNLLDVPDNRLSRWQHLQKLRQLLWQRWHVEYLQELQRRVKWSSPTVPIELGNLVLLIEDNVPPLQWPLGRIVDLHPGKDGNVRVVSVKTQTGVYKRAVKKLCLLPIDKD